MVKITNPLGIVVDGSKIADITEADTSEHTKTPSDFGYPPNVVAIWVKATRAAGSGNFYLMVESAGTVAILATGYAALWVKAADGKFYYKQEVKNDDWDIYGIGYLVEGVVKH